jgi:hypothetical protein
VQVRRLLAATRRILEHAQELQSALVSQDPAAVEEMLMDGEALAGELAATIDSTRYLDDAGLVPPCRSEIKDTTMRTRILHKSVAGILDARLRYLDALAKLLRRNSVYDRSGSLARMVGPAMNITV